MFYNFFKKYSYILKDFVTRSKTLLLFHLVIQLRLFERVSAERVNNQAGSSGRINVFSSANGSRVAPRALSICNADKMEMPERICKSSCDVIRFAAAYDESNSVFVDE